MHPRPPTDGARHDEKRLQRHVCVKFCAEENRSEENAAANSSPPRMHTVAASEDDGQCVQNISCNFPATAHGSFWIREKEVVREIAANRAVSFRIRQKARRFRRLWQRSYRNPRQR